MKDHLLMLYLTGSLHQTQLGTRIHSPQVESEAQESYNTELTEIKLVENVINVNNSFKSFNFIFQVFNF